MGFALGRPRGQRFTFVACALLALFVLCSSAPALAQATTGLWPDVSVPPRADAASPAEPSTDAALVVGIDRYDALPRIPGAADTARDWEKYFLFGRRVPPDRVRLLTDQNATVEAITARLRELADRVDPSGTLFVIFIGHGAPGDAGKGAQGGTLLGADARPSDASFGARGLSYEKLLDLAKSGKQARTVVVLDACFSGVSNEGKTLIKDVQPVVATKLITASAVTVFSAGSAAEYAGALPGSARPALSYLMLGALRGWADADGDGVVTAGEAHTYASLVLRSMPNNHEQHPQLVTDTDEVVLGRGAREKGPDLAEIRSKVDTWQAPRDEGPSGPSIRVAVGCADDEPRSPEDGLAVYLDGAPSALAPSGVKRTWDASKGRNVVEHVEFPIPPGKHKVAVRVSGCASLEVSVEGKPGAASTVRGALGSEAGLFASGPAANPDWARVGLGVWVPRSMGEYGRRGAAAAIAAEAQGAYGGTRLGAGATGLMLHGGLVGRWVLAVAEVGVAWGAPRVEDAPRNVNPAVTAAVTSGLEDASLTWFRSALRVGPRVPLGIAAVGLDFGGGYEGFAASGLPTGVAWGRPNNAFLSTGLRVDVSVLCDVPLFAHVSLDAQLADVAEVGGTTTSFQFGGAFQPSGACRRERRAPVGLRVVEGEVAR